MANFSAGHNNTTSTISGLKHIDARQVTAIAQQQQQQLMMMMQQIPANTQPTPPNMLHPIRPTTIIKTITTIVDGRGRSATERRRGEVSKINGTNMKIAAAARPAAPASRAVVDEPTICCQQK